MIDVVMEQPQSEIGMYRYYALSGFNTLNVPSEFDSHDAHEESPYAHGVVYLKYKIEPVKCMSYKLIPAENTTTDSFNFFVAMFDEEKRNEVVEKLQKMVNQGDKPVFIGNYAIQSLSQGVAPYIFGRMNIIEIGKMFMNYFTGNLEEVVIGQELTQEEQLQIEEEYIVPISFSSAQDFLILLTQNLK
jgi:hypothetical protein